MTELDLSNQFDVDQCVSTKKPKRNLDDVASKEEDGYFHMGIKELFKEEDNLFNSTIEEEIKIFERDKAK